MPTKAMMFIDGSWFYRSRQALVAKNDDDNFELDYVRMTKLVRESIENTLDQDIDLVRTCYFGVLPVNKLGYNPSKQKIFYNFLAEKCGYDVDISPVDYRADGDLANDRCVEMNLTMSAVRFAMMPGVFDIAVFVAGDPEYKDLLHMLRVLGKRTMLVTIHNPEIGFLVSPTLLQEPGLLDFPPLYLDDHMEDIRLVRKEQIRACKQCGAMESTTWAGPEFYCEKCRNEYRKRVRVCDECGKEEETTWTKGFFYCSECRAKHRAEKLERYDASADASASGIATFEP